MRRGPSRGGGRLFGWLAAVFVMSVLMACGGSGGDVAGVGTGGTGTVSSVVSMGPISGFGSVIVAGVRYDDSNAVVSDEEGNVRSRAELKLGMVTTIHGRADFAAGSGVAESIRYGSELVGPVEHVDLAGNRFTVLGAQVSVKASTVFDERLAGLAALRPGDVVEVYGGYNAAARRLLGGLHRIAPGWIGGFASARGERDGEGLDLSVTFDKLVHDAAREACGKAVDLDRTAAGTVIMRDARPADRDHAKYVANLQYLHLRFLGVKVDAADDARLAPWLTLLEAEPVPTTDTTMATRWKAVCIGLATHPDFLTY